MFIIRFSSGRELYTNCTEREVLDYAVEVVKREVCEEVEVTNEEGWILFTVVK